MKNEFTQVMANRTDDELIKIVTAERENYNFEALSAAEDEIEKRQIDTNKFETVKKKSTLEKHRKDTIEKNTVGSSIRFINYLIDSISWLLLAYLIDITVDFLFQKSNHIIFRYSGILSLFGIILIYYSVMEILFQKTVGKFVTQTKVVKLNGEKPTPWNIIGRTLCRFIPFDNISYLFVRNGLHDYLSKTKVLRDLNPADIKDKRQ